MNRIIAIVAPLLLLVNPCGGVQAQGCSQITGSTYTNAQAEDAFMNHAAWGCGEDSPILMAQCSPPVDGLKKDATIVVCRITVYNSGDRGVSVSAREISLTEEQNVLKLDPNTQTFEADLDVSKHTDARLDIATQPMSVRAGDTATAVIAFDVSAQAASKDMTLKWVDTKQGIYGFLITVHDREPTVADLITPLEPAMAAGQTDAALTSGDVFQGTSDDVIGPLDLDAGLYQVSVRYTGDHNFALWARQSDGTTDLLFNEVGRYSGEATFTVKAANKVVLEVEGIGTWEVRVEKLM